MLAGDTLKAAADLAVPMVGVGLFYRQGYFHQRLDIEGWQHEYWVNADFERLPAVRVTDREQRPLVVDVQVRDRQVHCDIWRVDFGRVPLYLLNTDRADNHPIDRWITARLYIGDRHVRLAQYAVLGIGGVRALQALGIDPILVHLNEGHAALSGFERARSRANGGVVRRARSRTCSSTRCSPPIRRCPPATRATASTRWSRSSGPSSIRSASRAATSTTTGGCRRAMRPIR